MTWRLDPATGDYSVLQGQWERDDGLETPVYLCLLTEQGSCLDDPLFGSRLHELRTRKVPRSAALEVPDMVREALQPLQQDGRIASVEVAAEAVPQGVAIQIMVLDSGQRPYVFQMFQEVG